MDKKRPDLATVLSCLRDSESVTLRIDRGDEKSLGLFGEAATLKDLDVLKGYFVNSIGRAPLQGFEIGISKDVQNNADPDENADDTDHIRFGDIVAFKTHAGDTVTGIVINIQDGNAVILYKSIYDDRLNLTYKLLEDLRRLKITYSEITEDVMEWFVM